MSKIKRYFAYKLLKFVDYQRLKDELQKRDLDDFYGQMGKSMIETYTAKSKEDKQ